MSGQGRRRGGDDDNMVAVDGGAPPLEWLALASLGLSVAFVFALTQPSVSIPPPDVPTAIAAALTILACAFDAAAIVGRLLGGRRSELRAVAAVVVLLGMLAAGGWLLVHAPGREVQLAWLTVPPAIGMAAVAAAGRRGSWSAVAFLATTALLVMFIGPRWS